MKKNKKKVKKGITLIEVIIGVALLSILIIPLSTIIITSLRNTKDGEDKQKASYIGQKVLEEIKSYDYIKLQADGNEKYFQLLDGDKIKNISEDFFKGDFERTILGTVNEVNEKKENKFKVEVNLKRNSNFNYEDINNIEQDAPKYNISFEKENGLYKVIENNTSEELDVNNNVVIDVNNDDLIVSNNNGNKIKISAEEGKNNSVFIKLKDSYDKETRVEVINNLDKKFEINLVNESPLGKLNIISSKGDIVLLEINRNDNSSIANMYNYEVLVKDSKGRILFRGISSNNIIIN